MSTGARIFILHPQVPYVRGGTEGQAIALRDRIAARGHRVDILTVPFRWEPKEVIIREMALWRMLDLEADLVIPLRFPAYCVKHARSVIWLSHQFRQVYELHGTPLSGFTHNAADAELRETICAMDTACLKEAVALYSNSVNTAARLRRYCGLEAAPLHVPPVRRGTPRFEGYGDFILAVGRQEKVKRFDLLLHALARADRHARLRIVGTGTQEAHLRGLAHELKIDDRVEFLGFVDDVTLTDLYASCRFVHFAPFDEDYGLIAIEAMQARKPVITAEDSGGPLELVEDGVTGLVAPPDPEYQAEAIDRLWQDPALCAEFGAAAFECTRTITWDGVLDELLKWLP